MAKRYQPSELIGEQGGVQTFAGRDAVNGLPVRLYSFMGEPTSREGELRSDFIPPVLSTTFTGTAGEVVSAFSGEFRRPKGAVEPKQVEALLRETAAALDDAARAGVVHGDLSPERVFFDREAGTSGRFVLEGYGVPWPVRPSEFSAPERIGGASFSGDIFSWARTVKHLCGPLPGDLRDLLDRCLSADPKERPHAREMRAALERYPFSSAAPRPNRQAHRDTSAFEQYTDYSTDDSGDYADDSAAEGLGAPADNLADNLSGLTLPPKTIKVGEYRRQQVRVLPAQEAAPQPASQATPQPAPTSPVPTPSAPVPPTPTPVNTQSGSTKAPPPKESLKQLDATEAYRARLATYKAQHGGAATGTADAEPAKPAASGTSTSETSTLETPASAPSTSAPPRPTVQVVPAEPTRPSEPPRTTGAVRVKTYGEARTTPRDQAADVGADDPDFDHDSKHDPEFEVIDDIDDRAPDPTLYRGGRRVLLLTLLGIALLVLFALQLVNA